MVLCEIFKGKGNSSNCKSYGDILPAVDDGKGIMMLIRSALLPAAAAFVDVCGLIRIWEGGLNGGETCFIYTFAWYPSMPNT